MAQAATRETYWILGDRVTLVATGDQTAGQYMIAEIEPAVVPGTGPPLHYHTREDEGFYVLEGVVALQVGDAESRLARGGFAFGPRLTPHRFWNPGPGAARMLVVATPAGLEGFFREVGLPIDPGEEGPGLPPTVPEIERVMAAFEQFGGRWE